MQMPFVCEAADGQPGPWPGCFHARRLFKRRCTVVDTVSMPTLSSLRSSPIRARDEMSLLILGAQFETASCTCEPAVTCKELRGVCRLTDLVSSSSIDSTVAIFTYIGRVHMADFYCGTPYLYVYNVRSCVGAARRRSVFARGCRVTRHPGSRHAGTLDARCVLLRAAAQLQPEHAMQDHCRVQLRHSVARVECPDIGLKTLRSSRASRHLRAACTREFSP